MRFIRLATIVILTTVLAAAPAPPPPTAEAFPARIDLIGAEIFGIDRSHSYLGFTIPFLGMTNVRGTFNDFTATILYDEQHPERSSVTLRIDPASIDTQNAGRDKDLQAETFFDVAHFPEITFQSTSIESKGGNRYLLHGGLTIKGVTRAIAIPMTRTVPRTPDAGWGNIRIGGTGAVTLNRHELGIEGPEFWNKALGDTVQVELDILGSRPNYERWGFPGKDKPSIGELMSRTLETGGAAAAVAQYRELRQQKPDEYNFGAPQLGILVNRLMQRRKLQDALTVLALGTEVYPEEPGFQARLGEAWAALGDRAKAIAAYEKAQSLNPDGTESKEMLRRLRAK